MGTQRSTATPLALAWGLLIIYASLFPFTGWRWPAGRTLFDLMLLPWPPWRIRFDIVSNLLGYLPLGALMYGAAVRSGARLGAAVLAALALPTLLSFTLELTQNFLPERVPSALDLALNAGGAALGVVLGLALHAMGGLTRWQSLRDRWFIRTSAGALLLLVLWPVGLLFPAPVPLGLGQMWDELTQWVGQALSGTDWTGLVADWRRSAEVPPLSPLSEGGAIALGLLGPCLIAFAVTSPGWRRLVLGLVAAALGLGVTALSTALNFGPEHALSWVTPVSFLGFAGGVGLMLVCLPCSRRVAAGLGLIALTAQVALVAQAPADPYFAQSLQSWSQGRFIRFHGLALWVGWVWPYLAMAWLLLRLGRDDRR